jgi:hypothetical protein
LRRTHNRQRELAGSVPSLGGKARQQPDKDHQPDTRTPEPPSPHPSDDIVRRVLGDFLEEPGLRLTEAEGCRIWGLDPLECRELFGALVDAEFLCRAADGTFQRVGAVPAKPIGSARAWRRRDTVFL